MAEAYYKLRRSHTIINKVKSMLAKFFVCVALVSMATAWKWGGCPKYTVMENFDV